MKALPSQSKAIILFVLIIFASFSFLPLVAQGARRDESKIKALEERLSAEKKRLEASRIKERDLLAEIESLDKTLKLKKAEVDNVKERIRDIQQEHDAIAGRLDEIETERALQNEAVSKKLTALYKHARSGYARLVFELEEIDLLRRAMTYAACMIEEDMRVLESHAAAMRKFEREKSILEADLSTKEEILASEQETLANLEKNMKDIVFKLVNINKEKNFYKTAIEELELASKEFKNTMTAIEKRASGEPSLKASKSDLTGAIPLPAEGEVILPPAGKAGEGQAGIFIEVRSGTEVQAVLPGDVEFSGPVKGYGETVIVNHGGMLYSISSHLGRRSVSGGKKVKAGEIIGVAGERAGKGIVYFEIRHGGRPLDARSWLNLES